MRTIVEHTYRVLLSLQFALLITQYALPATAQSRPRPLTLEGEFQGSREDTAFGIAVAIDGDTAIVGAPGGGPNQAGAAQVYVRFGRTWIRQQLLLPADSADYNLFGWSIALSRDTAVISAPFADDGTGAVYVFTRRRGLWSQQQKLSPSDEIEVVEFGWKVAFAGDILLAATPSREAYTGIVYAFTRMGGSWRQEQQLSPSDAERNDSFGQQVAVSGNVALVSAPWKHFGRGAVYAFIRDGANETPWSEQQKIMSTDGVSDDAFGTALALQGRTALIGAPAQGGFTGAAYVFAQDGSTWRQQAKLQTDDPGSPAFGDAIALSGDFALIAAPDTSTFVYAQSGGAWSQRQKIVAANGVTGDDFGHAVALSGRTAVIGAPEKNSATGAVYVFAPSLFP